MLHYIVDRGELPKRLSWVNKVLGMDYRPNALYGVRPEAHTFLKEVEMLVRSAMKGTASMESFNKKLRQE